MYTALTLSLGAFLLTACGSSEEVKPTESATKASEEIIDETTTEAETEEVETAATGESIFTKNNCGACHLLDATSVGPSLKLIATTYDGNKEAIVAFLKEESEPIVEPEKADQMKPQLAITKALPEGEMNDLADYILSHK